MDKKERLEKKKHAHEMYQSGKSFSEISKTINVSVVTVRRWKKDGWETGECEKEEHSEKIRKKKVQI